MMLRKLLFLVLFLPTTLAQAQDTPPDSALVAKVERLMEVSNSEELFVSSIEKSVEVQKMNPAVMQQVPEGFFERFVKVAQEDGYAELKPKFIQVYLDNFTEAEVDYQIEFYGTELGQSISKKQGVLQADLMRLGQEWGMKVGAQVAQELMMNPEGN